LLDNTGKFSKEEIERYYNLASTPGNILLSEENYRLEVHLHERIHKIITENLSEEEKSLLLQSRQEFYHYISPYELDSGRFFLDEHMSGLLTLAIFLQGSWQEMYAYMG